MMSQKKPNVRSLQVGRNGRFLERPDGTPFFYLGDTAWELFHRLSREEADRYLRNRADKGFTAVQAVVLAELDGLTVPNPAGHLPLIDNDPLHPNEPYFQDVDYVVRKAMELGLFIAMLPTWGDKWSQAVDAPQPALFNPGNALAYGQLLGQRYREANIIWVLGGDRAVLSPDQHETICAMARGLKEGDGGRHLISFHPIGQYSSAIWFHNEPWLDFNMVQTGHLCDRDNYNSVAAEYARTPVKPVIDAEPGYENMPHGFGLANRRLDASDTRKFLYWSLFAGAFGHTYGCNDIWQMYAPGRKPMVGANTAWDQAMDFPGAGQMRFARELIESGPYFDRLPDQSLIASPNATGADHVAACRAPEARWALLYCPTGQTVSVRTYLLAGKKLAAQWLDPRTGERRPADEVEIKPWVNSVYSPPSMVDWILILQSV